MGRAEEAVTRVAGDTGTDYEAIFVEVRRRASASKLRSPSCACALEIEDGRGSRGAVIGDRTATRRVSGSTPTGRDPNRHAQLPSQPTGPRIGAGLFPQPSALSKEPRTPPRTRSRPSPRSREVLGCGEANWSSSSRRSPGIRRLRHPPAAPEVARQSRACRIDHVVGSIRCHTSERRRGTSLRAAEPRGSPARSGRGCWRSPREPQLDLIGRALVCRNHVDVEVDPLEFSTRQDHSDREAESAVCAFPFERAWSANLEGEPVAEVEGS